MINRYLLSIIALCLWASTSGAAPPGFLGVAGGGGATSKFYWDCETTNATTASGTLTASTGGTVTLSTDQAVSGTKSASTATIASFYKFTSATIFDPVSGTIDFWVYGNKGAIGQQSVLIVYGDASNSFYFVTIDTNAIRVNAKFSGTTYYWVANNSSMGAGWNHVIFTYYQLTGSTYWSWNINGSAVGSGSSAAVWNPVVPVEYLSVVGSSGVAPTIRFYMDDITIK